MWSELMVQFSVADPVQAFDFEHQRVFPIIQDAILPTGVRCVEYHSSAVDLTNFESLPFVEQELVNTAMDRRKSDFGDSRWCAHQAMRTFIPDEPILRGYRGMPLWPSPVVGSITHTEGYRAAIVGRSSRWRSLGIDAEPLEPLPQGVFNAIARPEEARRLRRLARQLEWNHPAQGKLGLVLFSAKEATYKSWFPLTGRFLDFDEADIDIRPNGTFSSRLLTSESPVPAIEGVWLVDKGYVVTISGIRNFDGLRSPNGNNYFIG